MPHVAAHQGHFLESINLGNAPYNVGNSREDHSAAFTRGIQFIAPLYNTMRSKLEE
jgi:hypothetical protein